MKALIWKENKEIELVEKPIPQIQDERDAIIKVTYASICTSDLHIINGAVPNAIPNTTLGHEFVGTVIKTGSKIKNIKIGTRVCVNCETFCGECFFCQKGYINNCIKGGWKLGCSIDGGHAEYVRIPFADTGLTPIPNEISDKNALFVGDILSSGYFGAELCEIKQKDTTAIIGCGPVGLCAMQCAKFLGSKKIIAIDTNPERLDIVKKYNLADYTLNPLTTDIEQSVKALTNHFGADNVIEAAGSTDTFQTAWKIARPNATVAIVAMYESPQTLPLPQMYGKNLTFKTGGVDAIHCQKLLHLIKEKKINTDFLITGETQFENIIEAYKLFQNKPDNFLKWAIKY